MNDLLITPQGETLENMLWTRLYKNTLPAILPVSRRPQFQSHRFAGRKSCLRKISVEYSLKSKWEKLLTILITLRNTVGCKMSTVEEEIFFWKKYKYSNLFRY